MEKSTLCLVRDLGRKLASAADYDSAYLTWKETGGDEIGLKLRYSDAIRAYREAEALIRKIVDRTPYHFSLGVKAQTALTEHWCQQVEVVEKAGFTYETFQAWDNSLKYCRKLLMMLGEELMYAFHLKEGGVE